MPHLSKKAERVDDDVCGWVASLQTNSQPAWTPVFIAAVLTAPTDFWGA